MRRISIVGSSGSGKTTVGRALAVRLALPYVELDEIFHQPGWVDLPLDEFRGRASANHRRRRMGHRWQLLGCSRRRLAEGRHCRVARSAEINSASPRDASDLTTSRDSRSALEMGTENH